MEKKVERDVCLYAASKSDFRAAKEAAQLLIDYIREQKISDIEAHSDPIYSALHCALVVCYAKPFGQNKPNIMLKIDDLDKYLNSAQKQLHSDLIDMRNKCIAHSDHEFRNTTVYPPGSYRNNESFYCQITNRGFIPSKISEILSLIVYMDGIIDLIYPSRITELYIDKGSPSKPFKLTP